MKREMDKQKQQKEKEAENQKNQTANAQKEQKKSDEKTEEQKKQEKEEDEKHMIGYDKLDEMRPSLQSEEGTAKGYVNKSTTGSINLHQKASADKK